MAMDLSKARIKAIKGLGRKKHRSEVGRFLVEGMRLVEEAADSDFTIVEVLYTSEVLSHSSGDALIAKLRTKTDRVLHVSSHELETISETVTAQGILAVLRQKEWTVDAVLEGNGVQSTIVALDSISDPG
ncbi:MAG: hypothetical protein OEM41_08435, partial [Ignavibacteria bacterium]|nr:hypothetical protein [Ignavibacteria bacterium]